MRVWLTLIAVLSIGLFTLQQATAGSCSKSCSKDKSSSAMTVADKGSSCAKSCGYAKNASAKMVSAKGSCSVKSDCAKACSEDLMAGAPKMKFMVASDTTTLTTCCPETAQKAAKMLNSEVTFQVNDVKFAKADQAFESYNTQMKDYLGTMTKVAFVVDGEKTCCPKDAAKIAKGDKSKIQYRVASVSFKNAELANAAAKQAKAAADSIQMKYVVDGKEYKCHKEAGTCAHTKEKMVYKVGDHNMKCSMAAQAALMHERCAAAAAAVAKTAEEGQASASAS